MFDPAAVQSAVRVTVRSHPQSDISSCGPEVLCAECTVTFCRLRRVCPNQSVMLTVISMLILSTSESHQEPVTFT